MWCASKYYRLRIENLFQEVWYSNQCFLMQDHITNLPEEIGFITFDSDELACEVLKNQFHELNGKTVVVKQAMQDVDTYWRRNGNAHNDNYTFGIPKRNLPKLSNFPSGPQAYLYPVDGKSDGQLPPFSSAYPYTWYTPTAYSPMGYGPMGYGRINYGGWNCTNPNITGYGGHMQPGNIQIVAIIIISLVAP